MHTAPLKIDYHRASQTLNLQWPDRVEHRLSAEFLRVHSPSAEVRGHGVGRQVLQVGKKAVAIAGLEATGRYAIKIIFDDGHDSGLYDWTYLRHLGDQQELLWQSYLDRLKAQNASRESLFISLKQL
ncbi:MAG: DUF971 domain-containing protein [Reinekea forsetii]|jgi:DUF971 family protein|nr:DUF971 domain-containing protein [Reinekea forsetii]MDO7674895.1 DUF971 domain-containing protein [Reinekea forsetii]|tara:strand:+ start:97 stop:477 length:381 start_codon:yes stop_codon:yes gene_type:complete